MKNLLQIVVSVFVLMLTSVIFAVSMQADYHYLQVTNNTPFSICAGLNFCDHIIAPGETSPELSGVGGNCENFNIGMYVPSATISGNDIIGYNGGVPGGTAYTILANKVNICTNFSPDGMSISPGSTTVIPYQLQYTQPYIQGSLTVSPNSNAVCAHVFGQECTDMHHHYIAVITNQGGQE